MLVIVQGARFVDMRIVVTTLQLCQRVRARCKRQHVTMIDGVRPLPYSSSGGTANKSATLLA